jgi:hypothetical protein
MMMTEECKNALDHIDFLIDPLVRESLGITSRDLGTQVLRLCGGFNDLEELIKHKDELIFAYDATRTPVIDKTIIDLRDRLSKFTWIVIEQTPKHSRFVRLGNKHGTTECYWRPSKRAWFNRKGFQLIKHYWTHWQEIELPKV